VAATDPASARAALKRLVGMWRALRGHALRLRARGARRRGTHARLLGLLGGLVASGAAQAVDLPEDRADAMYHLYDGDGLRASGPALLVRKKLTDTVSLSGTYYVDMVSNASIDVVTTASPFKEKRTEYGLSVDYAHRDALISLSMSNSEEPDYTARSAGIDVSQEVFGGMTTVSLGFSRGSDDVRKKGDPGFLEGATHWRWRLGATQILTPTWLMSANFEAVADDGFLGSPYRVARVFGAAVPERNPRTRSSRAIKLHTVAALSPASAVHAEYRYFWDTWAIKAHTAEVGYSRRFGDAWLADWHLRLHTQSRALFYSDNASTETLYLSRNRQLSSFNDVGLGGQLSYTLKRQPGRYEVKLNGSYEMVRFKFDDFTDVRTGNKYSYDAHVLQLFVSATF
jgi:hypothetical protein